MTVATLRRLHTVLRALACLSLVGCETQPTHEVLSLTDLSPRTLDVGDRMEITGAGFPTPSDIRRITVRLSGSLARPGLAGCPRVVQYTLTDPPVGATVTDAVTGADKPVAYGDSAAHEIAVDSSGRLSFFVSENLVRDLTHCPGERFAPAPEALPHATVSLTGPRGGVTVLIETTQGTLLASARALRGPTLELHPPSPRRLVAELSARTAGERALAGLGIQLSGVQPAEGGLKIERVRPDFPADEAGIADGDTLERIDGATILTVGDFRPAPNARRCVIAVRRGDALDERSVRVDGLAQDVPVDLVATGVLLAVALTLAGILSMPSRGILAWLLRQARPVRATHPGVSPFGLFPRTPPLRLRSVTDLRAWAQREPALGLAVAAVATTLAAGPLGPALHSVLGGVDLGRVHTLAAVALTAATVASTRMARARSRTGTVMDALGHLAAWQIPAFVSLAGAAAYAGTFRAEGLVDAQGANPWGWFVFHSPVSLVLAGTYLLGIAAPGALHPPAVSNTRVQLAWRSTRGAATFALCLVASAAFLGGDHLPGVDPATQDGATALQMLGAMGLVGRAWVLLFSVHALRTALGGLRAAQSAVIGWRYLLPTATAGLAVTLVTAAVSVRVPPRAGDVASEIAAWTTLIVCLLTAGWWVLQGRFRRATGESPERFV